MMYVYMDFLGMVLCYVGIFEWGGYWVEVWDYDCVLVEYNVCIKVEDEECCCVSWGGGGN